MKVLKAIITILFLIHFFVPLINITIAEPITTSDPLTDDEKTALVKRSRGSSVASPKEYPIEEFSVDSSDGSFAVLYSYFDYEAFMLDMSHVEEVCVYNSDGSFRYAVKSWNSGTVDILLENGILYVRSVRGDVVYTYDFDGNLTDVINIENCRDEYLEKFQNQPTTLGGITYRMEDYAFEMDVTYRRLTATDTDGNTKVLYESKVLFQLGKTLMLIAWILIFVVAIFSLSRKMKTK